MSRSRLLFQPISRLSLTGWQAYAFAAAMVLAAAVVRWALPEGLGTRVPFPTFFVAVFVSAWVGGWPAGLLASLLTIAMGAFVFPVSLPPWTWRDLVALGFVFVVCVFAAAVTARLRRSLDLIERDREWHRRILDRVGDAVLVVDAGGALRFCNRQAARLWHLGPEDLGRDAAMATTLWFEDGQHRYAGLRRLIDEVQDSVDLPAGLEVRDGDRRLAVVGNVSRFVDPDYGAGAVIAVQLVQDLRDASRRAETMESELRLILETAPARIAYLGADGHYRWANGSFTDWFDFVGDIKGQPPEALMDAETIAVLQPALAQARFGATAEIEWLHAHPRLGRRWTTTTFTPDLDTLGKVRGIISLCIDSTERHDTEDALRRSDAEHRSLAENVPHMVWMAGSDGELQYVNSRWREFTGGGLPGRWYDAVHPDDRERACEGFARARADGTALGMELRWCRAADGAPRWHLVRAVPLHDADGAVWRWYGTCTDIQDQKTAQDTLREAHRRTTHFLATLSHELRNPLAALSASAALLEHAGAGDAVRSEASATIGRQTLHLKRLVDDLLDISRITLDKIQITPATIDLREICRDVCRDFSDRARRRDMTLDCQVPDHAILVHGDPARLRQCVDNLVSNALKASSAGMTVTVTVQVDDTHAEVVVADEGIGLAPESLASVFETFVQGEDWRNRGLGLGLSIVQRLVELHGGDVRAESAGPGHGARFIVRLPRVAGQVLPEDAPATAAAAAEAAAGVVLVVDDEADNSHALQYLLQLEGFDAHVADDGAAALATAAAVKPDVVLCDLGLPEPMDGYEVARRLRAMFGESVHLCAYSGYGSQADIDRSLAEGFDAHITKPGTPSAILAEIRAGLARLRRTP